MIFALPRIVLAALAAAQLATGPARAGEMLPGPIPAEVLRVVDGDTLVVRARIWLGQTVTIHVRLAGIDAPERKGRCAAERDRAAAAHAALAVHAPAGARVTLADVRYGKYAGRVMARVVDGDGADIGAILLAVGHVRSYDGRRREPWCVARAAGR